MDKEKSVIEEIKSYLYNDNIDRYNENIIIFFRNKIKKILDTEAKKKELFKNEDDLNEITKKIIKHTGLKNWFCFDFDICSLQIELLTFLTH